MSPHVAISCLPAGRHKWGCLPICQGQVPRYPLTALALLTSLPQNALVEAAALPLIHAVLACWKVSDSIISVLVSQPGHREAP